MFEDYLIDSSQLFIEALSIGDGNERVAKKLFRASVFFAYSAMESYINYLGNIFNESGTLTLHESAFLNDQVLFFDYKKANLINKIEFHKIDEKIKLLCKKFNIEFDFQSTEWNHFFGLKHFRDELIHPRNEEDVISISKYKSILRNGLKATIQIINSLSLGIFQTKLRSKILDLIPE